MNTPGPIFTAHLFPKLEGMLVDLLRALAPEEWELQTISPRWRVRDVAAHLLDTQLRTLSMARDGHFAEPPGNISGPDLVSFIDNLNREGVRVYRRLSPDVLISLMELASRQSCDYHMALDPFATAPFPVSWAGEARSANWFNTAREYTERWHHQQQIRIAVNRPGIMTRELYYPVLDCFMRSLPFTYRDTPGEPGEFLRINVSGECGGSWYLCREAEAWLLASSAAGNKVCEVTIPQEIAWRIFTKGIDRADAIDQMQVEGDGGMGLRILTAIAIVG